MFRTAKESILITTWGINEATLAKVGFMELVRDAIRRAPNLKIYIYFNDRNNIEQKIIKSIADIPNIRLDEAYTHSKLIAADRAIIEAGSFNWLAEINCQTNT